MSIASRNGKLRMSFEDDGTRVHAFEYLLTANVFGAYRYLPFVYGIGPFFACATNADGCTLIEWADKRGVTWSEISRASIVFWPSLARREPDLIIAFRDESGDARLVVLVEIKLHSDQHSIEGKSQIGFYGAALLDDQFDEPLFDFDLPELRPVVLITKDRDAPRDALVAARCELGDYYSEERTDAFWVSWHVAVPESKEVLIKLQKRYKLGLITNGAPDLQWKKIEGAQLTSLFDSITISGEHGFAKPDSRLFEVALKDLGSSNENTMMTGDSLKTDIMGGSEMGLRTVWINRNGKKAGQVRPDFEIDNLRKLERLLI